MKNTTASNSWNSWVQGRMCALILFSLFLLPRAAQAEMSIGIGSGLPPLSYSVTYSACPLPLGRNSRSLTSYNWCHKAIFVSPNPGVVGEEITFLALPHPDLVVLYLWDFSDGQGGFGQQVTRVFEASGSIEVQLTVIDVNNQVFMWTETVVIGD